MYTVITKKFLRKQFGKKIIINTNKVKKIFKIFIISDLFITKRKININKVRII